LNYREDEKQASIMVLLVFVICALIYTGLFSCAAIDSLLPNSWQVPAKRKFEVMATARHQQCVWNNSCIELARCHRESEQYCLDAGYSKTCGNEEREGSCGENVK